MIELIDLHKSFGKNQVLAGLNLTIEDGMTTVIIGRSGGGKSVLLKHIIGLMKPDRGRVLVDGVDITRLNDRELNEIRKKFGMLFQEAALFDSMTVGENVAFPLREHARLKETEIRGIVTDRLRAVGLPGVEEKMPAELSGGMRKRVGLARAIALHPRIVLFDEPTTGLDPVMTEAVNQLIVATQKNFQLTCVVISHDLQSIFRIGHKIAMLYEGVIIAHGTPEEIQASRDPVIRQFLAGSIEGPIRVM
ncbi:MAG TPA: ABC transporter ATP-binding protein [Syntrophales bacterium]|jgi:phospholipid/cholesterol/gamma-HCH transport system ATP-binding protein|nr:ABC transporter ATP-binding protein [Syntrophales bacterium]HON22224.1 ABC transporter ATP-binding protein [Syntrophales bacterium]HOU77735.1 ABC transporter ATP-binding protein [Syntrophales bacterium]HPC32111.1 ABC transporter ATP-binding protein [Syntrophales bacterium]HQG33722.1 ABC transporter ATP-binding protein [Syntrophales bacterium]